MISEAITLQIYCVDCVFGLLLQWFQQYYICINVQGFADNVFDNMFNYV